MGCYTVPIIAELIHIYMKSKNPSWKTDVNHSRLSMLLYGGAIFGVVDHLWNGELFLFNNLTDLFLGLTITVSIFVIAGIWMFVEKTKSASGYKI